MSNNKSCEFVVDSLESAEKFAKLCEFVRMIPTFNKFLTNSCSFRFYAWQEGQYAMFLYNKYSVAVFMASFSPKTGVMLRSDSSLLESEKGELAQLFTYAAVFLATYWFHNDSVVWVG